MKTHTALWSFLGGTLLAIQPLSSPLRAQLIVGSSFSNEVLRFDEHTGAFIDVFVTAGSGGLNQTGGLAFSPDGNYFFAASRVTDQVLRYNGVTGQFVDVFVSSGSGGLDQPNGVAFGPDGNLYVTSNQTNQVLRYNGLTGLFLDVFVTGPLGADIIGDLIFSGNNLYVVSRNSGGETINQYDATSGAFINALMPGHTMDRKSVIIAPDGDFLVSSRGSDQIARFDGTTGDFEGYFVSAGSGGIGGPLGMAFGPDGNFYVGGQFSSNVVRYDGVTGQFIDNFVAPGTAGLAGATIVIFRTPTAVPEASTVFVAVGAGIFLFSQILKRTRAKITG